MITIITFETYKSNKYLSSTEITEDPINSIIITEFLGIDIELLAVHRGVSQILYPIC